MMHTTVSTSSTALPAANAQLVYSGQTTLQEGPNTFIFSNPFQYNGIDNLALIVLDMTGSWSGTNYWFVHVSPTGDGASLYAYNDNAPYSTTTPPSSSVYTSANRNNIIRDYRNLHFHFLLFAIEQLL